ncbi:MULTISPECIES: S9 family peptidase [unclassified Algoriphagus]|jgi:acylaminoacyl-peptidase|uniref:S9 family peptidase n=2 Tax=Algoriphagus TaxID=246875 RepID=UPI000C4A3FEE|nr:MULTISPECIES: S9 family peptidase [unclassified Algoriphagus]MAL13755.1 peptidase S9 family protein [Algoriphagus sp.]QYH40865.1 S9 family peptidase [Algoriphagus sp. NBT04N3]HAS59710.1 peptidase S9 family protein [Algoriphagus sp.]HCB46967.1 peptidase S9 family protein [Algoriphagus sp.]HCH46278.1 peptidase S9 family protein [Algoriphagus sp.]|tara:strand:- start:662 stop:2692 length:2031 start_codon:yes stop_codon:yes gene_type:complete
MKKILLLWIICLGMIAQVEAQVKTALQPLDLFDMEYVTEPSISPDGSKVVYVRNFKDIMTDRDYSNLWIVNSDGSQNRPITQGNQRDYAPVWSHDGTKLAFLSNQQDDKTKLFVHYFDTQTSVALTNSAVPPGSVSWSYDNQSLAFTQFVPSTPKSLLNIPSKPTGADWNAAPIYIDEMVYRRDGAGYVKPGNRQIFTIGLAGGTARQWTSDDHNYGSPVWSKDGKSLFFSANLRENAEFEPANSEIYQLNLTDGSIKALTNRFGPDSGPVLSPDGKKIAYTGNNDTFQGYQVTHLYVMNTDGSGVKNLTEDLDRDASNPQWDANGQGIYFQYDEFGDTKVGYVALTGKVRTIVDGLGGLDLGRPYNSGTYSVSANNKIAFTEGGPEHPADLAIWSNGTKTRVTRLNDDLFSYRKIGKTEELWWESSFDGKRIQGWIVTPPDFDPSKKYPFILEIHGGPFAMYGPSFAYEIQAYAAAGYVVLYTNPRGSTGYGQEFGNSIHHDYPNHDYEDLMSGVDAVIEKGYIDTDNLFVTGGSGGGVLTAWIIGKTDRFKAAVVAKPVINWYSFVLHADNPVFFTKYWFGAKPWEDVEYYHRRSPISLVGNVKTPTMLLTGENDYRTPISESEQYYAALKLQGVESAMVRIPNASHGLVNRPSMLLGKNAAILSWFNHYRDKK